MTGPRAEISAGCPGAARAVGAPNAKPIYSAPPSCCCSSVSSCFGSSLPAFVLQRHAPCPPSPPSSSASLLSFALSLWLLLLLTRRSPTFCSSPAPPPQPAATARGRRFCGVARRRGVGARAEPAVGGVHVTARPPATGLDASCLHRCRRGRSSGTPFLLRRGEWGGEGEKRGARGEERGVGGKRESRKR